MSEPTALEGLALEMLAIESPIGHERALVDWIEARARERGFDAVERAGDNLALRPRPRREDVGRVLLVGHVDTVPPAGANPARLEGDRLHGLGASDMKAADALILSLLERAVEVEPPRHDLAAVLYAREEGPYETSGMPEVVRAAPWAFEDVGLAVVMEPTDGRVELGAMGTLHAWVAFRGQRAHSARPWQGRNAIHMAAPLLSRVARLAPRDVTFEGYAFREVCSATMVDYDGARNVIPGGFRLNLNFRFAPDRSSEDAVAWVERLVADAAAEAFERGDVAVEITDLAPSGRVCASNPLLEELVGVGGVRLETGPKQAWTDVGRLSRMGLDAVNYGPGSGAQAHQAGEHCLRPLLAAVEARMHAWLFG